MLSFRLGGTDGVSIEAAKWSRRPGTARVSKSSGSPGRSPDRHRPGDTVLPWLAIDAPDRPGRRRARTGASRGSDLVVVENLCSLPLNEPAATTTAAVLASFIDADGRVVFHHHDLPWQRPTTAHVLGFPPALDALHVAINELLPRRARGPGNRCRGHPELLRSRRGTGRPRRDPPPVRVPAR